ncbi:septum formation initiator [Asanoa sp. WMMD1127]|uniref:septum formation initiator n=1 Tax=Asanoa sp. WMMD1127 TaxID=3016107 RepID=UPI002417CEEE|nr:septum formation initiator [Asanoa sp. WMMD1127]MDG4822660.1 septum formation initiator [Asanoa sp. WMMD1127]
MSRWTLAVLGWLAAVVVATLAGVGAIRLVGNSFTGTPGGVRSEAEVARDLAAAATPAATPSPSRPATTPPSGDTRSRSFSNPGGSVVASCRGRLATIDTWSPAQGYSVRDLDEGPDDDAEVKFEGAGGRFEIKIECRGGTPVEAGHDD